MDTPCTRFLGSGRRRHSHISTNGVPLRGDRSGSYSIRINDQWRLCFRFAEGDAYDVEIVDYH